MVDSQPSPECLARHDPRSRIHDLPLGQTRMGTQPRHVGIQHHQTSFQDTGVPLRSSGRGHSIMGHVRDEKILFSGPQTRFSCDYCKDEQVFAQRLY